METEFEQDIRLLLKEGDIIKGVYRVVSEYKNGGSSNVYKCINIKEQKEVTIKAFTKISSETTATIVEKDTLLKIKEVPESEKYFLNFFNDFTYKSHYCMVMECGGANLYEVQQFYKFRPFRREAIRQVVFQTTKALKLLDSINKYHTDLKLENILIDRSIKLAADESIFIDNGKEQTKELNIKIIDFGAVESTNQWSEEKRTTIYYRAPEVLMEMQHGKEIDVWALGAIIVELYLGKIPFITYSHLPHIISIQHMLGKIPNEMLDACNSQEMRDATMNGVINPSVLKPEDKEKLYKLQPLFSYFNGDYYLQDLVMKMMQIDPLKRISLDGILQHPFIKYGK